MRVVIDTNILISYLIGKTLSNFDDLIIQDKIKLLFSEELYEEFISVVRRPKFKKYFQEDKIQEFISILSPKIGWIDVNEKFTDCRDKKDNFLLDLCVSGRADYLITGDKDLLDLDPFHGTRILSQVSFEQVLNSPN